MGCAGCAPPKCTERYGSLCQSLAREALLWEAFYTISEMEELLKMGTLHFKNYSLQMFFKSN